MSARDHAAVQRTYDYVNTWPEELRGAFWSAVNAGTYTQSAEKTLAFATALAHELAEKIREDFRREFSRATANMGVDPARLRFLGAEKAADLIDPEVE